MSLAGDAELMKTERVLSSEVPVSLIADNQNDKINHRHE